MLSALSPFNRDGSCLSKFQRKKSKHASQELSSVPDLYEAINHRGYCNPSCGRLPATSCTNPAGETLHSSPASGLTREMKQQSMTGGGENRARDLHSPPFQPYGFCAVVTASQIFSPSLRVNPIIKWSYLGGWREPAPGNAVPLRLMEQ